MGSATLASDAGVIASLASKSQDRGLIILTDPDVAGRQSRNKLDQQIQGCLHAFVPTPLATAKEASKYKEVGNVGIEHAAPEVLLRALSRARLSDPARARFTREDLIAAGLIADKQERNGNVTRRRFRVCDFLGVGLCDGKQLMKQLNRYNFTAEELKYALQWAEREINT
jgi:ribonuclease M5